MQVLCSPIEQRLIKFCNESFKSRVLCWEDNVAEVRDYVYAAVFASVVLLVAHVDFVILLIGVRVIVHRTLTMQSCRRSVCCRLC